MKNPGPGYFTIRINIALQISCQTILAIVLLVFLRYTDSEYPFGIFKLFQHQHSYRPGHLKQPSPVNCERSSSSYLFNCCFERNVFFNHMVGKKTTGEQISILCHNGTIFDKPRGKLDWPSKDMLESKRIQNRSLPCLTIGLGN